jgi:uncharacterized protein (DUF433 family)
MAVFPGTRVPVYLLFDYLIASEDGLKRFLLAYPHIDRAAVNTVLELAKHTLTGADDADT